MFVNTGDYLEQRNDVPLCSTYYTFTPRPLMDGGFYTMTNEFASLLVDAHRGMGILEGLLLSFHDKEELAELIILKESHFSRAIDYSSLDLNSMLLNRGLGKSDDEANNITSAYHRTLDENADKMDYDYIARCALYGSNSKQKVGIRGTQIFLSKSISNYRQYNPTAPKDIRSAMNDIERYVELDGIDVLIKSAMCHYQFEMIHPYECYNGIVGRLLMYKMLYKSGLKGTRYLSFSECLYNRKAEYFKELGTTQKNGSYAAWIEFFISIISESTQVGVVFVQDYINIIRADEDKLASGKINLRHLADVYKHFKKNLVSSINQTSRQLQISFNAASRAIKVLQGLGILTQVIAQSRNRLFAHTSLMQLFLSGNV